MLPRYCRTRVHLNKLSSRKNQLASKTQEKGQTKTKNPAQILSIVISAHVTYQNICDYEETIEPSLNIKNERKKERD